MAAGKSMKPEGGLGLWIKGVLCHRRRSSAKNK